MRGAVLSMCYAVFRFHFVSFLFCCALLTFVINIVLFLILSSLANNSFDEPFSLDEVPQLRTL